jgi:hypothetical protein
MFDGAARNEWSEDSDMAGKKRATKIDSSKESKASNRKKRAAVGTMRAKPLDSVVVAPGELPKPVSRKAKMERSFWRRGGAEEAYKMVEAAREHLMKRATKIELPGLGHMDKLKSGMVDCKALARQLLVRAGFDVDDLLNRYDSTKQQLQALKGGDTHEERARKAYLDGLKAFSDYEKEQRNRDPAWTFEDVRIMHPFLEVFAKRSKPDRVEPFSGARTLLSFADELAFYQDSGSKFGRVLCMDNPQSSPPKTRVEGTCKLAKLPLKALALFSIVCGEAFESPFAKVTKKTTLDALVAAEMDRLKKARQRP